MGTRTADLFPARWPDQRPGECHQGARQPRIGGERCGLGVQRAVRVATAGRCEFLALAVKYACYTNAPRTVSTNMNTIWSRTTRWIPASIRPTWRLRPPASATAW